MEQSCIGSVVRSLCGRDRKRIFMIVGICEGTSDCVYVCDGRLHPLSKPKKKNLRHLAVLAAATEEGTSILSGKSDEETFRYLESFEKSKEEKDLLQN